MLEEEVTGYTESHHIIYVVTLIVELAALQITIITAMF